MTDPRSLRLRPTLALKPRDQPPEVLRYFAGKHDADGVAQFREEHMLSDRAGGFGEVVEVAREAILGEPFEGMLS
jgi:hypothetical protein